MKEIITFRKLLIFFLFFNFSFELIAQENFTPEEKIVHDKLVKLLFDFDLVEWEYIKTDLKYKNFPIYHLSHAAVKEALVTNEIEENWVFSENDGPDVVKNRFDYYDKVRRQLNWNASVVSDYVNEISKIRKKEDYKRLKRILDEYQPGIPHKNKLIFVPDQNRKVTSIYYSSKGKKLPKSTEILLLNLLQENNYQTHEEVRLIHKPSLFRLRNKFKRIKTKIRIKIYKITSRPHC